MADPIRVLVVDDESVDRIAVRRYLASVADPLFTLSEAVDGASALAALERESFHCVLLDLHLPDVTGIDWLRQFPPARERPPVVLLTALEDERVAMTALQQGAQDYLVKDQLTAGLLARSIRYAVERGRNQRAIDESRRQVEQVAFLDPLTRLLNRRGLEHMLRGDLARAARSGVALAGIVVDCDDLEAVGSAQGDAAGDEVLKIVASRIETAIRTSDRAARVGADQFLLVLPDSNPDDLEALAERLRSNIAATPIWLGETAIQQRVSVGTFAVPADARSLTDLLAVGSRPVARSQAGGKKLAPYFQPIVRLADRGVCAHEIFVRAAGIDPDATPTRPGMDLEALLICAEASRKLHGHPVHFNLRWDSLASDGPRIAEILRAQIAAGATFIELAVAAAPGSRRSMQLMRESVRNVGAKVVLEDFDLTQQGLDLLLALEPDVLKIDARLVRRIAFEPDLAHAIGRLVAAGRGLGARVFAQGVETETEYRALRDLGVEAAQGRFFRASMPADQSASESANP